MELFGWKRGEYNRCVSADKLAGLTSPPLRNAFIDNEQWSIDVTGEERWCNGDPIVVCCPIALDDIATSANQLKLSKWNWIIIMIIVMK